MGAASRVGNAASEYVGGLGACFPMNCAARSPNGIWRGACKRRVPGVRPGSTHQPALIGIPQPQSLQ